MTPAKVMLFAKPPAAKVTRALREVLAPLLPAPPPIVYANEADWRRERPKLTRCEKCGGLRLLASLEPHAPRFIKVNGVTARVDCAGTVLE